MIGRLLSLPVRLASVAEKVVVATVTAPSNIIFDERPKRRETLLDQLADDIEDAVDRKRK